MESAQIVVSGFPEGTSKTQLMIYFQSERQSGGGDVDSIEIDRGRAFVTFEDLEAAKRVARRRYHRLQNSSLRVRLLLDPESPNTEDEDGPNNVLDNPTMTREKRPWSKGPATFEFSSVTRKRRQRETFVSHQCTVKVTGVPAGTSQDLLTYYFENPRRSNGGTVIGIDMKPDLQMCLVTFELPEDAKRTAENSPHNVGGLCLHVSLLEEQEKIFTDDHEEASGPQEDADAEITITASGIPPSSSEDSVRYYFENSRRSGGGEVCDIDLSHDGKAVITFTGVEDLQKLLQTSHFINGKAISVERLPPRQKIPPDPFGVYVQGLNEKTTEDCLLLYLEKFSDVEVKEVIRGCDGKALAIFVAEPDFQSLFENVHGDDRGLEGSKLRLEHAPVCTCVRVSGLKDKTTEEMIKLYFENRRCGGNVVSKVERETKNSALVYFQDPSSLHNVFERKHTLEGNELEVQPFHHFLENTVTNKKEIPFDAHIFEYIKRNHGHELQTLKDENKVQLFMDINKSFLIISPSDKRKISQKLWRDRTKSVVNFILGFKKIEIPLSPELFDEISERWQKERPREESSTNVINFSRHDLLVQIFGKEDRVDEDGRKLQDFILAVEEDKDLMRSKVKVIRDGIPKSRLRLLEMTGICEKLQSEQQHLNISIDLDNETLCLNGPRNLVNEVQAEVFTIMSKMIEKTIELPTNITRVLKMPSVSSFIQHLLKQKGVQAIFVHDQYSSSNEVQVISVDSHSAKEAEKELLGAIQENSIRLTDDNAQVLDSRLWKDFQTTLTSKFKVDILVKIPCNTVWVSGIAKDVKQCYDQVIEFLQKSTILCDTVPLDHGSTRFVFERLRSEIEEIKRDLASCSIDMRMSPSCKGIDISGTAEGIDKCLPRLVDLIKNIQKVSVPIDKPGMTKFFSEGKGPKSLKAIEDSKNCIIITSERNGNTASPTHEASGRKLETSSGEFICSYLTVERKKISVFKNDITKHRVDAIVNPANEELKHIGGLAAAIVKVGGTEIQGHCNEYIEKHGPLLEGGTFVTPAGMLPCDRVIHTVGPKWDTAAEITRKNGIKSLKERVLEIAIRNCLKEAASLRSIAIPAVSSGQFGFPRDLCAKVILDSVVDFCKANPTCNLSEIHLVNHDSPTVKVFVDEMRNRFAQETNFIHEENPTPMGFGTDAASNSRPLPRASSSIKTPEGIHIVVKVGDLSQEKANILVGTASGNLDLDQNPCAMALSKAAGQGMQRECSTKKPVALGDIVVLSQTGRLDCQAVIFAICCDWNNGQGRKILKDLLTKCLKEADTKSMTSIAFAAIGTGTLRFPRDQVAEIYFDEVIAYSQKNPSTKVKDVRFVLYDKDTLTVQAFNAELQKRFKSTIRALSPGTTTFSPVIERRSDHLETNVGTLCFQVQPGDITKESTEAIAIITNNSLDLSVGQGAGAAILKKGGDSLRNECSMYGPQAPGSIVVTKAGGLNVKYLFHIVPLEPLTAKSMKASVLTCLQEADKRRVASISFPAIGTGILGMSAKSSANTMLSAVRTFSDQQPAHVQLIKMTIFQTDMIKDVRSAVYEASGQKIPTEPGMLQKFAKSVARRIGLGGTGESSTTPEIQQADSRMLNLVIFAGCERDLHRATEAVKVVMAENSSQRIIKNEVIRNLSKEDMRKIHSLEQCYAVEATVEKGVDQIELRGQPEDIVSVIGDIHELLYKIRTDEQDRIRAEVVSKDIQWKYKIGDTFVEYERHLNAEIEIAYHQKRKTMKIHQDGEQYKISFVDMTEEDENGQRTEIKRIDSRKGLQIPEYWDPQPHHKKMHIVELNSFTHAQEYNKVCDLFNGTCSNRILKLERIQNPTLYGLYAIQRGKMDDANGLRSNEKLLFHGTSEENCNAINHKGFNRSYGWQKNNLYGKGVYFAAQADYSASSQFSPPGPTGRRHMYLARVLVGQYTVGKPDILEPPPKHPMDLTDTYDSVVDQIPNPEIFVVFQDAQCYPEYLITFH